MPGPRAWLALTVVTMVGCADPSGPSDGPITRLPRALTVTEEHLVTSSNAFGLDLMREVVGADSRPNVVLSPLSASMALGMTLNGADGTTFDAMRATLGFDGLTQGEINDAYRALIDILTELDPDVRFDIANAVWAREDVPFHDAFFQAVSTAFDARAEARDFADAETLVAINAWVEEATGGLIDSILEELDPALVMLLVNAIYFDGAWTTEFDPGETRRASFTREDGSTVEVDMMSMNEVEVPRGVGSGYEAVELPYGGEAFSMVVLVPSGDSDARSLLAALDADAWESVIAGLEPGALDLLSMPKFTISFDAFLNEALEVMGMEVAFGPGADFTRMSPIGDQLCIDFVRQKTHVEVDERGTRAAAVTAVGIGETSFNGLIVDRPFVFAIRERLSGTILFVGLVGDPAAEDPGPEPYVSDCG